jgi:hypothetical protein
VIASVLYLLVRQVLELVVLALRSDRKKDIEIVVLRRELAVLRRNVERPRLARHERIVLSALQRLRAPRERSSFLVSPDTLRRWHRELVRRKWHKPHRVVSRRAIPLETQLVIWRMAQDNPAWGYRRLKGELAKVGIEVSTTSIRRILETRPRPRPNSDHWRRFLRSQAASIVACDFFTVETLRLKTLYVLFFIELETRRVFIAGITDRPSPAWATQLARNVATELGERQSQVRFVIRDRDHKYRCGFDEVFAAEGVKVVRTPTRAPKANAYAERWIRTVRRECLDWLFVLNARHLAVVLDTYVAHYNRERPHRGRDLRAPEVGEWPAPRPLSSPSDIGRRDRLGGLSPRVLPRGVKVTDATLAPFTCTHPSATWHLEH